jgi:hypothetical protein
MVRALVGDSTMTSVVPAPDRRAPVFVFGAFDAAGAFVALVAFGVVVGLALAGAGLALTALAFGFETGAAFPAAFFGNVDFGFVDFFGLVLAIGLDITQSV